MTAVNGKRNEILPAPGMRAMLGVRALAVGPTNAPYPAADTAAMTAVG